MSLSLQQQADQMAYHIGSKALSPVILRLLTLEAKVAEQQSEINSFQNGYAALYGRIKALENTNKK
jgi:hypothetical protein